MNIQMTYRQRTKASGFRIGLDDARPGATVTMQILRLSDRYIIDVATPKAAWQA